MDRRKPARLVWAVLLPLLAPFSRAMAQHASDNPVVSADDAFGLSVGLESTGLYNPGSIRGFNPQTAGNARIDGLYFDQQAPLTNRVIEGSTIRVGISEIGYAFPAPTGIVDYDLRHTTDGKPTATIIAESGPFDDEDISIDGSLPLDSKELQLPIGMNFATGAPPGGASLGYTSKIANLGAAPVWKPNADVTVRVFVDWQETTDARTLPTVFTGGDYLPPEINRGFQGQYWALGRYSGQNFGGLIHAKLSSHWSLAAGIFRSVYDVPVSYADLFENTQPNGLADHVLVGLPDQRTASNSGEARLTGAFTAGQWSQKVVLVARGRDEEARYGGADAVDAGTTYIGAPTQIAAPDFVYTQRVDDHTQLWSTGAAYQVQRAGWGEFAFGAQKEFYDKTVLTPGSPQSHLTDDPDRVYGTAAIPLPGSAVLYSDYTQGFEDSGAVPSSAANRGAILPTTRTWQIDGGVRYPFSSSLSLIAGYFELNRPYFNFDADNVDRQLGDQRASGLELSLAGEVAKGLYVNVGALVGHVQITGSNLAEQGIGTAAVGQPSNMILASAVYSLPHLPAFSVDLNLMHFSSVPAAVDNVAYVPQVTVVNPGARYQFTIAGAPATLRAQLQNAFNAYIWNIGYSPGFLQFAPRTYLVYLTVDLGTAGSGS
jgi:iron complex outermembrane receptor protein